MSTLTLPKTVLGKLLDVGAELYGWYTAQATWRKSCAAMAELLPDGEGLKIVDLGCGPGVSTFELARLRPGSTVVGLDLSPRMLTEAGARARSSGLTHLKLGWVRSDAGALPFRTGSLDALTGHSFLYLLPHRDQVLAECMRVLRPGGRLVLMEPNHQPPKLREMTQLSLDPRFLLAMSLWRPASRISGRFSATSLRDTLTQAGFVRCQVEETLGSLGLLALGCRP
jgi:ubiquinone/menaquinone biosynthesis C-methylase UbiE